MKTSYAAFAVVAFATSFVRAQLSAEPSCAQACISSAIVTAAGCGINDYGCQCGSSGIAAIESAAIPCLIQACDSAELSSAQAVGQSACAAYASATAAGATTTGTSVAAGSTGSSVASKTTGSSAMETTSMTMSMTGTTSSAGTLSTGGAAALVRDGFGAAAVAAAVAALL